MDLFSEQIGAEFHEIQSFSSSVGGSPTNIAIGSSRLGLTVAAFTAVGDDAVGRFVCRYLEKEGVDTSYVSTKASKRTGLAVLGIQPPDRFPLVFYREDPADIHLTIDEAQKLPLDSCRILLLSGTALSRGSCRDATLFAAEKCQPFPVQIYHDLDLRPDQWNTAEAYGIWQRRLFPFLQVIIGTEEEFYAALAPDPVPVMTGEPLEPDQLNDLTDWLQRLFQQYPTLQTLVLKRGAKGVSIFSQENKHIMHVAGFSVQLVNTVGAGDAFASGLIQQRIHGKDWATAARFANACGALVVSRHGCAAAMPDLSEVLSFLQNQT